MSKKTVIITVAAMVLIATSMANIRTASAEVSAAPYSETDTHKGAWRHAPGVFGTVISIKGDIISIQNKKGVIYTVDTNNTKIMKDKKTVLSLSDITVGDPLIILGQVSGSSISASTIFDGPGRTSDPAKTRGIAGIVRTVSGTTIGVTGRNGTQYIVDASNAEVVKISGRNKTTSSVFDVSPGDTVLIRGKVTDTTISADKITDGKIMRKPYHHPRGFSENFGKK